MGKIREIVVFFDIIRYILKIMIIDDQFNDVLRSISESRKKRVELVG